MPGVDWVLWKPARIDGGTRITDVTFEQDNLFRRGVPLAAAWSDGKQPVLAVADKHADTPPGPQRGKAPVQDAPILADALPSRAPTMVVSARLADALVAELGAGAERLPVTVVNHKKRPLATDYAVINLLGLTDALDQAQSRPTWFDRERGLIDSVRRLVIKPAMVGPAKVFRLAFLMEPIFFRRDLAERLTQAGFTGLGWQELADYPAPR